MKTLFQLPAFIYAVATITSLGIMVIIDYILGTEAEHLNAWVILNRIFGNVTNIGNSLAIEKLGLAGATLLMLALNFIFGFVLVKLLSLVIKFFHWL